MIDPKGYYATLGVDPDVPAAAIHAAFRKRAKVLHPDVPVTGNAGAFLKVKEAYEVLSDVLRRGEYDRLRGAAAIREKAWAAAASPRPAQPSRSAPMGASPMAGGPMPGAWADAPPELADLLTDLPPVRQSTYARVPIVRLPTVLWTAFGVAVLAGIGGATWRLMAPQREIAPISTLASGTLPDSPPAEDPGPPATGESGSPHYVLPVAGSAMLWSYDAADRHFRPAGRLTPFTPVSLLRFVSHGGLAEVRLAEGTVGYIYPHLLAPGDAAAAQHAACVYNAGAPPQNGERLDPQHDAVAPAAESVKAPGPSAVTVTNAGDTAAVFALLAPDRLAAVYVEPHAQAVLTGLPTRRWRVQYATGDLWSRTCFRFTAGMRARLLPPGPVRDGYTLPAEPAADIPDEAFAR
jgi:hypothetical protein